ncbi:S-adenosyl-L-methionine-dependent methyltransferase [Sporormia fimetaria CBS 119925]|uniref:Histone-lysine N-methyltransferase, H3 lysine-79 specific n=1 Tax=Sporormia fimetaria CBS 119925 TaxID=1340428 RepID=A0A6A6V321_9PLEO|nr:S-adenosyl-L-methionine-dependent methyltransferase [Sporormia fimetaria CBS 119925]
MFGASSSKPKIRTRKVRVAVKKTTNGTPSSNAGPRPASQSVSLDRGRAPPPPSRTSSGSAYTATSKARPQGPSRTESRTAGRAQRQLKRKATTPSTPQWASSSDEASGDEDEDRLGSGLRKRQKTSSSIEPVAGNRCLEPDYKRRIRIPDELFSRPREEGDDEEEEKLIHSLEMTRGDWAKDYKPAFPDLEENLVVELQYPSPSAPEKFELVVPRDPTNFNPLDDLYFTMEEIITHYLPPEQSSTLLSETSGPIRLLKRAVSKNHPPDFRTVLQTFNTTIHTLLTNSTISTILDTTHAIPLSLTKRILAQVYLRTVSPHAHKLRRVKDKETTYGELLPPFIHTLFSQTSLNSTSTFVDLGSGVGNVVLQSALQTGATSYGIEILSTPADFATKQARELRARAKLYNISLGPMTLLHGSFLESPEIDTVLQTADVVLVNNKVFDLQTNTNLLNKFLDLKIGAKVR